MSVLKFKKFHSDARIDFPAMPGDVGYDIYAVEEVFIPKGENRKVPVGFALEIPEGYYVRVATRSGHGIKKGLQVHSGTVDSGFRGVLDVTVYNHSQNNYLVEKGEKIAQLILEKSIVFPLEEVQELSESVRGEKGFGSTGR
jgi:deoxyuridine 5'-triphosphate nucleotidohydrolase